jgi:hypothetical protein
MNSHDFTLVEQLRWATKYVNVRRTELIDLTFDIVIATCPIVPTQYFQTLRELFVEKMDKLWEHEDKNIRANSLVDPEYEFEAVHRSLLYQVKECRDAVSHKQRQISLNAKYTVELVRHAMHVPPKNIEG